MTPSIRCRPRPRLPLAGAALAVAWLLAGCAAAPSPARLEQAATAPLADFNLVRTSIPPVLQTAQAAPYARPADRSCAALQAERQALDEVLGADLDTPAGPEADLLQRGATATSNAAVAALQRTAEGVVPFRGWVRKLTGAERHAEHVAAAIAAGTARRAFLRGLQVGQGCAEASRPVDTQATNAPAKAP